MHREATPAVSSTREALFVFLYLQTVAAWDRLPSISARKLRQPWAGCSLRLQGMFVLAHDQPYVRLLLLHRLTFTRKTDGSYCEHCWRKACAVCTVVLALCGSANTLARLASVQAPEPQTSVSTSLDPSTAPRATPSSTPSLASPKQPVLHHPRRLTLPNK